MPCDSTAVLYGRLMETARQVQVALDADADAGVFLALLETHQGLMAELKQMKTGSGPDGLALIHQAAKDVADVLEKINKKRDELVGQIMRSKSRKRAFDAYHKI